MGVYLRDNCPHPSTKKVTDTPHKMWTWKVPSLAHIKVWGCEAFVRHETHEKLKTWSDQCIFIGYPYKSFGYLFYRPSDNVVFTARTGVFRDREFIGQGNSGGKLTLKILRSQVVKEP